MYNLKINIYHDSLNIRLFDRIICHDKKKKTIYNDVPFTDCFGVPYQGREVRDFDLMEQESLRCSLSRTRSRIRHISRCFQPKYFVTFTFNKESVNRYDYDEVAKAFSRYLRSLSPDVQYIVVPELHADGAFHFHGLFSSQLPVSYSGKFKHRRSDGSWSDPFESFHVDGYSLGFSDATVVKSSVAVSNYIVKYITKDLCAVSKGKKRYWYSKSNIDTNVTHKFLITKGNFKDLFGFLKQFLSGGSRVYECENQYCKFKEFNCDHTFFADIADFCSIYDSGLFSVMLC